MPPRTPDRPGLPIARLSPSACWATACLLLAVAAPAAAADAAATAAEPPTSASEAAGDAEEWGREPPPLWTVGLFGVAADHAVYPGASRRARNATVLPFLTYRGPVLRLEGGTAGVRALRRPRAELDFSAAAAFGSDGVDKGARAGMPAIGTLVEIGPSLRVNLGALPEDGRPTAWRLDLPLRFVFDADRDFEPAGVSFEPRVSYRMGPVMGWTPSVHAGLLFGSQRLNSLYYEVAPQYATPTRPAYEAQGGLVASRVGTSWSRLLLPTLRLGLHASVESVRGAANEDSPVVGRSVDPTFAVTLTWTAWRSEEAGVR